MFPDSSSCSCTDMSSQHDYDSDYIDGKEIQPDCDGCSPSQRKGNPKHQNIIPVAAVESRQRVSLLSNMRGPILAPIPLPRPLTSSSQKYDIMRTATEHLPKDVAVKIWGDKVLLRALLGYRRGLEDK